jgi:hypothetical protein
MWSVNSQASFNREEKGMEEKGTADLGREKNRHYAERSRGGRYAAYIHVKIT